MPDSLGDRMEGYENVSRIYLPRRLPVIIRVDGRAFHTFTKGFQRPFDKVLAQAMRETAIALCKEISGAKLAYTQSDEISILVTNNDTLETQPWFNNNLQKLVSLSASTATLAFDKAFYWATVTYKGDGQMFQVYAKASKTATFDSRAFVLPPDEVTNYFIWRQQDAVRNSIQMVAQSLYSHKELQNKNCDDLQEMIFQKGINWNEYEPWQKRGICVRKNDMALIAGSKEILRGTWEPDFNTPVFTQDRNYINNLLPKGD